MKNLSTYISVIILLLIGLQLSAQGNLRGIVKEKTKEGEYIPIPSANVYWLGTTKGTTTDETGRFSIARDEGTNRLVVSFVGLRSDTLTTGAGEFVVINLKREIELEEVEVEERVNSNFVSQLNPIYTEKISEQELKKAACCNLSESFETNPSVDVSFTDAVTGLRTIRMLGLDGPYIQITQESTPGVRGLSSISGLTFIPGPWVESIQLMKGSGSVVNGFESIAGQINVELKKPEEGDKFYLNLYGNQNSRLELNSTWRHEIGEKFSTSFLVHGNIRPVEADRNDDGFQDFPTGSQVNVINRWKYIGKDEGGIRSQWGIQALYDEKMGGQTIHDHDDSWFNTNTWGMQNKHQLYKGWGKIGYVFPNAVDKSIGLQVQGLHHQQDAYFGQRKYDGRQNSFYANLMFQNIIKTSDHTYRLGLSYQMDDINEQLDEFIIDKTDHIPGIYGEYTYQRLENFTFVLGLRADYIERINFVYAAPRMHIRYAPVENLTFRVSGGRAYRSANVISENLTGLASSRTWQIAGLPDDGNYKDPFDPEDAWNVGGSVSYHFTLNDREGSIRSDFFHTRFTNQVVVDKESSRFLSIYTLEGKSYSNSLQIQLDYELIKNLDIRLAYRFYDVEMTYNNELLQKPLLASNRAFANLSYQTGQTWSFDFTVNWQGEKRIPNTRNNPKDYQLPETSPDYVVMNAQITKCWKKNFEIYVGMENIGNFRQDDPILSVDDPYGDFFDASLIWGPVAGRNTYAGFRWSIN